MTESEAGRLGGKATLKKYGKGHMSKIGKRGSDTTWDRYKMVPYKLNEFAMVEKRTNIIVAIF